MSYSFLLFNLITTVLKSIIIIEFQTVFGENPMIHKIGEIFGNPKVIIFDLMKIQSNKQHVQLYLY